MQKISFDEGASAPLGATVCEGGVNFAVFSRNAAAATLLIFAGENDEEPCVSFDFDGNKNKTGDIWHIFVRGIGAGFFYLYKIDGEFNTFRGTRFNKKCLLIDPFAKALTRKSIFKALGESFCAPETAQDVASAPEILPKDFPKCCIVSDEFDWQGDKPLNLPLRDCIIYEAHLKGFTAQERGAGTFSAMEQKIPYLKSLGVTSVELMPIQEFDENENFRTNPKTGERLTNFWGYSTVNFFSPKASYAHDRSFDGAVCEFKKMVRAFHKAGLEVILDVVFNHTAEGNERGATFSFRGFDNSIYYILSPHDRRFFADYTGCGNTVNANHPVVQDFIVACLCYWVSEMHVDGFRFDLGSALARGRKGELLENPPLLERIAENPILRKTKIIAEAWDARGAYQVGSFPGGRWAEWNDKFRDATRRFWRGDEILASEVATRISGSSDLYQKSGRKPFHSINFVSCHDGFTMNDLVCYEKKHNEENGEGNCDGAGENLSENFGFEGDAKNPQIENARIRRLKNFFLTLLLSAGTPMFVAGDEFRRTQRGNNNAWCQDNEISYVDWSLAKKNAELLEFVKKAILLRKNHAVFRRAEFFEGAKKVSLCEPDIQWFDELGKSPEWKSQTRFLSWKLAGEVCDFFIMMNASGHDITARLPRAKNERTWRLITDTSICGEEGFFDDSGAEILPSQAVYVLPANSMAVCVCK